MYYKCETTAKVLHDWAMNHSKHMNTYINPIYNILVRFFNPNWCKEHLNIHSLCIVVIISVFCLRFRSESKHLFIRPRQTGDNKSVWCSVCLSCLWCSWAVHCLLLGNLYRSAANSAFNGRLNALPKFRHQSCNFIASLKKRKPFFLRYLASFSLTSFVLHGNCYTCLGMLSEHTAIRASHTRM